MIIWRGWGILTVAILAVVGGLSVAAVGQALNAQGGNPGYAVVVGLAVAAAVNWVVGRRLNGRPGRELIDARTGERVVLRTSHALFFVPMQWWSVPMLLAAAVALAALLAGSGAGPGGGLK